MAELDVKIAQLYDEIVEKFRQLRDENRRLKLELYRCVCLREGLEGEVRRLRDVVNAAIEWCDASRLTNEFNTVQDRFVEAINNYRFPVTPSAEPTPKARRFRGIGEIYELRNGVVHQETTKTNIPVTHIFDCVNEGLLHEIDADGNRIETPEAKP